MMLSPWVTLPPMLLLAGAVLGAITIAFMLRLLLRPQRMSDAKAALLLNRLSPEDLGLNYERLIFFVRDHITGEKLKIASWWIPHSSNGAVPLPDPQVQNPKSKIQNPTSTIVLIHGYADAKVGAIAWAPLFHSLGYNVFALDLRAHGESDGRYTTAGDHERYDVDQVLTELRQLRPDDTHTLILFGVSLGAAVAAGVSVLRDDIAAVILECPYADFRSAAMTHARLLGLPRGPAAQVVLWLAQKLTRADYAAVRPVDVIPRIPCPLLLLQSGEDELVEPSDAAAVLAAARQRPSDLVTECHSIPSAGHVLGFAAEPERYRRTIESFLARADVRCASCG